MGVSGRILQRGISSLAKRKFPTNPHILRGGRALGRNHDGRLGGRLVGSLSPQDCVGKLARTLESSLNELERAKGNPLISSSFQGRLGGPEGNGLVRQRDCNVLPEETRILVFPRSNGSNSGYLCSPRGSEHFSSSNTFEGKNQCLGRPGVQEGSHPDRVVPRQQNLPLVLQASGNPSSGFVCHPVQPEASQICLPMPGSGSGGLGFIGKGDKLEPVEIYIPLSAVCSPPPGGWLARILRRGRIHDSPFMDSSELVPSFEQEMSREIPSTQNRLFIPEILKRGSLPQGGVLFKSSRVEVIMEAVIAEGLTEYSAKVLGNCHRKSTLDQYQSVWLKFLKFLKENNIEHWDVRGVDIINFLSFYAQKKRAYKTLAVYKNALRLPLLFTLGLNMESQLIKSYMKGLFNKIPPSKDDRMPIWDINVVLRFLLTDIFCPPESASFHRLEQKTFFLFLLGTSRRLHEICSLSIRFFEIEDRVLLYWLYGFRAKNHNEEHAPAPPSIKKMSHYWKDEKELYNCPVANWKVYLQRRLDLYGNNNDRLWTKSQASMCASFKSLVLEALRKARHNASLAVRPHQLKKLSISLCGKYWAKAKEMKLESLTGNKCFYTLERHYLKKAPKLKLACSVPLGTVPPRDD